MNFYKRAGVGRYNAEEQMMLSAINSIIEEKQIPLEQIPDCHSFDELVELKQFLESYEFEPEFSGNHAEEQQFSEDEELNVQEKTFDEDQSMEDIHDTNVPEEDSFMSFEERPDQFISTNYSPFAEPIIERSYNQADGNQFIPGNEDDEQLELEESKGNPLSDLPPHTKRRAAEQTADTMLKGYAQIAPVPFKWWAKFPESKIEKMAFNGELDLSIEVSEGVTFDEYIKQTNAKLDEIFEVDSDTLNDIREPLVEVLMEQNMVLTPAQRLIAAVVSHVIQMITIAVNLSQQHNRILSYQKHLTHLMQGSKVA